MSRFGMYPHDALEVRVWKAELDRHVEILFDKILLFVWPLVLSAHLLTKRNV
jgi:hypothetical protein